MKPITVPGIDEYAESCTSSDAPELVALVASTRREIDDPDGKHGMVGPVEGRLLQTLVWLLQPKTVLEIGTFTGYSALAMAAALPPDGQIVTCEMDPRHAEVARRHIAASGYADKVRVEVGDALESIARLEGPFDFVFIDADKTGYIDYFEAVLPKLADRGLIAADNTLLSGEVLDLNTTDPRAITLRRFNELAASDPRVASVMLTVRDGLTLIRRAPVSR